MRRAALALVSGVLLATAAPGGWLLLRGGDEYGAAAVEALADPVPPTVPVPLAPGTGTVGAPQVATSSARLVDVVDPRDPPAEVRFADRSAPVDAVGLDAARQVVVPEDVRRAGWYAAGPQPGDRAGSAVLVGHADDADQGLGTFATLRDLRPGNEVVVRTASGRELAYSVVSFERFAKAEVPMDRLFTTQGPHRLVLVSCGGAFDPVRRTYADNVVVTAVPRT